MAESVRSIEWTDASLTTLDLSERDFDDTPHQRIDSEAYRYIVRAAIDRLSVYFSKFPVTLLYYLSFAELYWVVFMPADE